MNRAPLVVMRDKYSLAELPTAARVGGWLALAGAIPLAARLVWEQTLLTRANGPQMVGFSLIHIHGELFVAGLFFALCVHIWLLAFVVIWLYRIIHQSGVSRLDWAQGIFALIVAGSFWVPYGVWQLATTELTGAGPEGATQLSYAAANDQRYLVKALLRKGVPVDAVDVEGSNALSSACRARKVELARYLISKGATLDRAEDCRAVNEFASRMKSPAPTAVPKSDKPRVPGMTIEVTAEPPPRWTPAQQAK